MTHTPNAWQRFLSELRRRKVYRTFAAWAIGVFAIWQVIDIAAAALSWPDTVLTVFVIGSIALSPIVIALAWVYDIRRDSPPAAPIEPEPAEPAGPIDRDTEPSEAGGAASATSPSMPPSADAPVSASRRTGGRAAAGRRAAATILAPAVVASAGIVFLLWPGRSSGLGSFEAGDPTLISRCENTTGDANYDGVLNTALDATIRQSQHVSIFSHDRARTFVVNYLGREATTIDGPTATEIGRRLGFKVVIHCSIHRVGEAWVVTGSIVDPRANTDLAIISKRARNEAGILDAIDDLAAEIRSSLGESLRAVRASQPLAMVTTPSLDALVAFTAGVDAWRRADYRAARELYEGALLRDSMFAAAHAALANFWFVTGDAPRGTAEFEKALRDPTRVSERDRMWIEGVWAANRGDLDRAIATYSAYLVRWPTDANIWYNLGSQHFRNADCEAAGEAFARSLAIDPTHASSEINLASCLVTTGRADSALVHYERAFAIEPAHRLTPGINHEFGSTLVEAGRVNEARQLFTAQLEGTPQQQAGGHRSLGLLDIRSGHYRAARPMFQDAIRLRQARNEPLSEYRDRLYLAGVLDALGDDAAKRAQVAAVTRLMDAMYVSPGWLLRVFRRHLADGQVESARAVLERAAADTFATDPTGRAAVHAMRAHILVLDGRATEGLEEARLATTVDASLIYVEHLCRIALITGANDVALDACTRLADPVNAGLWEATDAIILANHWLGTLHERMGNTVQARERYVRFLELWNDADAGLRMRDYAYSPLDVLADVRKRLAGMTVR